MQIAVYMGIKDIYLLGCDFNYSHGIDISGRYFENRNVVDHFDKAGQVDSTPNLQYNYRAYLAAEKYARSHGFRIYNATRGGKLDVYERVDFDSLFINEHN